MKSFVVFKHDFQRAAWMEIACCDADTAGEAFRQIVLRPGEQLRIDAAGEYRVLPLGDGAHLALELEPAGPRRPVQSDKGKAAMTQPKTPEHPVVPDEAQEHELKCWPPYFEDIRTGRKNFECRVVDRYFREGDVLRLREWDPDALHAGTRYTGRELTRRVTYVLEGGAGGQFGIRPGHAVLSLSAWEKQPNVLSPKDLETLAFVRGHLEGYADVLDLDTPWPLPGPTQTELAKALREDACRLADWSQS